MTKFKFIGKPIPRDDAWLKVTGRAKYADDFSCPMNVYVYRSKVSHAKIKSLDISQAKEIPGVISIITAKDIPGENLLNFKDPLQPLLANQIIRYEGEPIALIVTLNKEIAELAFKKIHLELEIMEGLFNPLEALEKKNHIRIHNKGNISVQYTLEKGDINKAFKEADIIIENEYLTSRVEHAYLEPHAGFGEYDDGVIKIILATQSPHLDRDRIMHLLKIPSEKVRVIQAFTGGGFGGKLESEIALFLALAVYNTKQKVKILFSREEDFKFTSKRHPFIIKISVAANKEGKLIGLKEKIIADTGAYDGPGPAILQRAVVHCSGPYNINNIKCEGILCYTNNITSCGMRGFGVPQVNFAIESQLDILSKKLNISPNKLRLINCLKPGDKTITGQVLNNSVGIKDTILVIEKKIKEEKERMLKSVSNNLNKKIGIGCASMYYGIGKTGVPNPSKVRLKLLKNGKIYLYTGCVDIGQGSTIILKQIIAQELNMILENITIITGDTKTTPDSGLTSASRQTFITGKATQNTCKKIKDIIFRKIASVLRTKVNYLCLFDDKVFDIYNPSKSFFLSEAFALCQINEEFLIVESSFEPKTTKLDKKMQGIPYATYGFASQCAIVEVNIDTGLVRVIKIIAAHDVGKSINVMNVEGQIEGGCVMGLGQALLEVILIEEGKIINTNFSNYLISTSLDVPEIESIIIEKTEKTGPFGAKGIAECTNIPTMAAISNAINDAIGIRMKNLPITAENVLKELKKNSCLF